MDCIDTRGLLWKKSLLRERPRGNARVSDFIYGLVYLLWFPGEEGDQEVPSEVLKVMNKHLFQGSHKAPIFKSMLPCLI